MLRDKRKQKMRHVISSSESRRDSKSNFLDRLEQLALILFILTGVKFPCTIMSNNVRTEQFAMRFALTS